MGLQETWLHGWLQQAFPWLIPQFDSFHGLQRHRCWLWFCSNWVIGFPSPFFRKLYTHLFYVFLFMQYDFVWLFLTLINLFPRPTHIFKGLFTMLDHGKFLLKNMRKKPTSRKGRSRGWKRSWRPIMMPLLQLMQTWWNTRTRGKIWPMLTWLPLCFRSSWLSMMRSFILPFSQLAGMRA